MGNLYICVRRYLYDMNIDEQEFQPRGEYNLAGVHLGGMRDTMALEDVSTSAFILSITKYIYI